jgi:integrase
MKPTRTDLTFQAGRRIDFCMAGTIRTKQVCPKCKGKFQGEPLHCSACLTIPTRYFLDVPWKGERLKIYSGKDGHPIAHWEGADRLINAIRHEIDQGKFDPKEYQARELRSLLFSNYCKAWIIRQGNRQERGDISAGYLRKIKGYANKYFVPFFQQRSIRDIREGLIEDFRESLPANLSSKTVRNILGVLNKIFRDAYRRRDIVYLPELPKIECAEPVTRWITREEQEIILGHIKSSMVRAFVLFLMKQGCRPGEARALRWEDVDFRNDIVIIRAAMDEGKYRSSTKEKEVRYLPLHPEIKQVLRGLPRDLAGFVFVYGGKPLRHGLIWEHWNEAAKAAEINISLYEGTRHSFASQAINLGKSRAKIGKFLGHKSPKSTDRYAKLVTESLREIWEDEKLSPKTVPRLSPPTKS